MTSELFCITGCSCAMNFTHLDVDGHHMHGNETLRRLGRAYPVNRRRMFGTGNNFFNRRQCRDIIYPSAQPEGQLFLKVKSEFCPPETRAMPAFHSARSQAVRSMPAGYAGFIPGLISGNIHGAPWKVESHSANSLHVHVSKSIPAGHFERDFNQTEEYCVVLVGLE
jgi:hypothetical protein